MPVAEINYVAVLVAGLLSMVIGFGWYSLKVFGKSWMKETGLKMKDIQNWPGKGYAVVAATSLLQAYVLAHFVDFTNATTWFEGAQTSSWIWIGFVATAYTATYVFSMKSPKLWMIDAGYFLVVLMAQGALLAVWV
jgi:hypothetical protein